MRCTRLLLAAGFAAALLLELPSGVVAGQTKRPPPEAEKLAKARKFIHTIFADDYARAAKALAERRPLAVALRAARSLASGGTKPRLTNTTLPSDARSGVNTQ